MRLPLPFSANGSALPRASHHCRAVLLLVLALSVTGCAAIYAPNRVPPPVRAPIIAAPAPPRPTLPLPPPPPPPPTAITSPVSPPVPIVESPVRPGAPMDVETPMRVVPQVAQPPAFGPPPSSLAAAPPFAQPQVAGSPPIVALILPLDVPAFARAADAVRAGFLAAAGSAGGEGETLIIGHAEDGVLGAFEAARAAGADVIVGPLIRDDVRTVAQLALELPYTIALNQLDDGILAPAQFYTFSLGVESDARLIARRLHADAARSVAVVSADTPLMRRFAGAFAAEWGLAGGNAPTAYRFDANAELLRGMRRALVRNGPDGLLLAVDSATATLAKPYLGNVPAYASGLVFEQETQAVMRDLDGLMVVEIPWLITPNAPQFANLPRREFPSYSLTRLYALGLDAFRVAQAFRDGPPRSFSLEGATGQVTLTEGRQFSRVGRFAVFRSGQLSPLDGAP